jgi:hypothetical protein
MQPNSEYLALALDVRKLTDSLVRLVEEGNPSENLRDSIQKVVSSLQGSGKTSVVKSLRERGPFGRYAGVRAISEVFGVEKRNELAVTLRMVIESPSAEEQRESALAAIPYFDALERRALYHHSRAQAAKRYVSIR